MKDPEKGTTSQYQIEGRLEDVIALITILGIYDTFAYRSPEELKKTLGPPRSASDQSWLTLAREHGEFFRVTKEKENIILLARFANNPEQSSPEALSIDDAKLLIDIAVELHNKQLARETNVIQKKSVNQAFLAAIVTAVLSFSAALFSVWNSNENDERVRYHLNALENKIDLIQTELKVIEANKDSTRLQK